MIPFHHQDLMIGNWDIFPIIYQVPSPGFKGKDTGDILDVPVASPEYKHSELGYSR